MGTLVESCPSSAALKTISIVSIIGSPLIDAGQALSVHPRGVINSIALFVRLVLVPRVT